MRTKQIYNGNLLWTPMYGKYQLSSGRVIYFDTTISAGFGVTSIGYEFSHCTVGQDAVRRGDYDVRYQTLSTGLGQRYYLNKYSAFRWDLRSYIFFTSSEDGACVEDANATNEQTQQNNLTIELGYSFYL